MNPDKIRISVDGEIFVSGKKKLRIQKYPDTCERGLRPGIQTSFTVVNFFALTWWIINEFKK